MPRVGAIDAAARTANASKLLSDHLVFTANEGVEIAMATARAAFDSSRAAHAASAAADASFAANVDENMKPTPEEQASRSVHQDTPHIYELIRSPGDKSSWIERVNAVVDAAIAKTVPRE